MLAKSKNRHHLCTVIDQHTNPSRLILSNLPINPNRTPISKLVFRCFLPIRLIINYLHASDYPLQFPAFHYYELP